MDVEEDGGPFFPPELERQIFEAQHSRAVAGYRTPEPNSFAPAIQSKPDKFRRLVRNLFLTCSPYSDEILSACPGVENLWIPGYSFYDMGLYTLEPFNLKRLYISGLKCSSLTSPLFANLPHIDFMGEVRALVPRHF
ncbi:hypothetical protein FB45DRAFT_1062580 [Roridomyces roridus]|uniref:Uncharacterized protein n=1 Tax=Roridomyces roridus TaxID=1738132 RepID=A0AAD7BGK9_9AGAR|nr:hypothetical protein FB45DRAFT_1062580 [Roridomyces roridus]